MKATRHSQPYRRGARTPGPALAAMLAGQPINGRNPMDVKRRARKRRGGRLAAMLAALQQQQG